MITAPSNSIKISRTLQSQGRSVLFEKQICCDLIRAFLSKYTSRLSYLSQYINPLNTELNPICHRLALLGAHHILHVSRLRVNVSFKSYSPAALISEKLLPVRTGPKRLSGNGSEKVKQKSKTPPGLQNGLQDDTLTLYTPN